MQIPELLTQRKFVSVDCHAHSTAQVCFSRLPRPL